MTNVDKPVADDHTHVAGSSRLALSLDDIASIQPGVARLMLEVSNRFSRGYHAAKAKNARLARFQLNEGMKVLRICAVMQPRYAEAIQRFSADHVDPLRDLMEHEQWDRFDELWQAMTDEINRQHEEFDHGFLIWRVSQRPPDDILLEPGARE